MNKITLNIKDIINARLAIDKLLRYPGIIRKKVYWLKRNSDHLLSIEKEWHKRLVRPIREIFEIEMPPTEFISPTQYSEFKKELLLAIDNKSDIQEVFSKYEISIPIYTKAIPIEKQNEYQEKIKKAADEFNKEVEFSEVETDKELEEVFKNLTGEEQLSLSFMIVDKSAIEIVSGIQIYPK